MDKAVPIFAQTLDPLGLDVIPAGELTFDELVGEYRARLTQTDGAIHINGMCVMAECRAAILAAKEKNCGPIWVSWLCDEEGESPSRVQMLAALFVAEGMGAAAFGIRCDAEYREDQLRILEKYASVPLFYVDGESVICWSYTPADHDPDALPCATGTAPCFVSRTVDVGEELECTPNLLENIIAAEDDPVGALKISVLERDDIDIFAQEQYAVGKALCLWSDVPELMEQALRVYQGRAFYDGTGDLEPAVLERLSKLYGLIIL